VLNLQWNVSRIEIHCKISVVSFIYLSCLFWQTYHRLGPYLLMKSAKKIDLLKQANWAIMSEPIVYHARSICLLSYIESIFHFYPGISLYSYMLVLLFLDLCIVDSWLLWADGWYPALAYVSSIPGPTTESLYPTSLSLLSFCSENHFVSTQHLSGSHFIPNKNHEAYDVEHKKLSIILLIAGNQVQMCLPLDTMNSPSDQHRQHNYHLNQWFLLFWCFCYILHIRYILPPFLIVVVMIRL
jgi:hypothetical protein